MESSLLIYKPNGSTDQVALTQALTRIGRGQDNDIVLEDPQRKVSRQHAQILCEDRHPPVVIDLMSANGTLLNGLAVPGRAILNDGDVLNIGLYRLIFRGPEFHRPEAPQDDESAPAFEIEAASVNLDQLQDRPRLLELAASGEVADTSPVDLGALELLHEVSVRLARTVTVGEVSETAIDLLFQIPGVQRATLIPWDEERQTFQFADVFTRGGKVDRSHTPANYDPRSLVLSRTILGKVREENRPLHIRDARSVAEASGSLSIVRAGIQAALCSPLSLQGRFLGVLYADNLAAPDTFSPADFRTFTCVAAQAGLALASALARDLMLKREVEMTALRLYLPPQVAAQIAAADGSIELGGVLQDVTVLFADIRGFTHLSEQMEAQDVVLMLNEFFTAMTNVIMEAGGTLDKYIGDCVMALFGAPVPGPDDADRAVRAAVGMQRQVARLNVDRARRGLPEINMGIGLHTGPAVVGNIGSSQRMQYTAIGDTVNVAARIVATATAGQVLVSEDIRAAATGGDRFEPLGEVKLKGRQQMVNIYAVTWEQATL